MPLPVDYAALARSLYEGGIISDPWIEGRERFRLDPVLLSKDTYHRLCDAAEGLGRTFDEGARIVAREPELLESWFGLTPYQKMMWEASSGRWHGIARLDLFLLEDGSIRCCEMNSDTPSGEAEAVLLNRLLHPDDSSLADPNREFEERFIAMLLASHAAAGRPRTPESLPTVGILYPTDMPEDLSMIALYGEWLTRRGHRVVLGSPFNLSARPDRGIALMGEPVDIIIRHYKTDWWGEREVVWADQEEYPDPDPISPQTEQLLAAEAAGRVVVVNPFGAVVTQNKLMMALLWERREELSPRARAAVEAHLPETRRLDDLDRDRLAREEWVIKTDYGCEGDDVVIGPTVDDALWRKALELALPKHWIAQRYFRARTLDAGGTPNFGLYLIAGEAAGIFTRIAPASTDYTAVTAATFVDPAGDAGGIRPSEGGS